MDPLQLNQTTRQIHRRTLGGLVLLGLLIITFFRYTGAESELANKIVNESSIITSNISASIVFNDSDEIQRIHQSILYSKEIRLSCIYNNQGLLMSQVGKVKISDGIFCGSEKPQSALIYVFQKPIDFKKNSIGRIEIYVSRADVITESIVFFAGASIVALLVWLINFLAITRLNLKLKSYESQLQQLIFHRDSIIEDEHRKIAIEIHDQIGQLLSSANFNIRYLRNPQTKSQANQLLNDTEKILSEVYSKVKNISAELHPSVLDFGIQAAIEWLAETRLSNHNIEWSIKRNKGFHKISNKLSIVLFKITQEAFTNILKHSHASSVIIQLHSTKLIIKLVIKDNGIGMGKETIRKGKSLGLIGISERAKAVGGKAEIHADRSGTSLTITLPNQE
jgi:signal transduction histidine kinase